MYLDSPSIFVSAFLVSSSRATGFTPVGALAEILPCAFFSYFETSTLTGDATA